MDLREPGESARAIWSSRVGEEEPKWERERALRSGVDDRRGEMKGDQMGGEGRGDYRVERGCAMD